MTAGSNSDVGTSAAGKRDDDPRRTSVSVLGLGEMGRAPAGALVDAGHPTTVWNRSPGKADDLVARGAQPAVEAGQALAAGELVIVCPLDHVSVHEVLDPHIGALRGRTLVNVTTTTPDQSRESAAWAAAAGVVYVDGGIMAVPGMIGRPGASILYSGSAEAFEQYRPVLELWGESVHFGEDAGLASLYDLALPAGMYVMFAGFLHGVAMVAPAGVTASELAGRETPRRRALRPGSLSRAHGVGSLTRVRSPRSVGPSACPSPQAAAAAGCIGERNTITSFADCGSGATSCQPRRR